MTSCNRALNGNPEDFPRGWTAALRVATPWPKHAEAAVPKNPVRKSLREVSMLVALKARTTHCVEIDPFLQYKKYLPIDNLCYAAGRTRIVCRLPACEEILVTRCEINCENNPNISRFRVNADNQFMLGVNSRLERAGATKRSHQAADRIECRAVERRRRVIEKQLQSEKYGRWCLESKPDFN